MDSNEKDLTSDVPGTENDEKNDTVMGDMPQNGQSTRDRLLVGCVWARYVLPLFTALLSFLLGCFYNVGVIMDGRDATMSTVRLYVNTLIGTHDYLGGKMAAGRTWFYGILSAGAIVGILLFLASLFLAGLAAYTAVCAFRAGRDSEESNRMKMIFKVPFPNRVWLYLSNLLVLLPLLYPHFVSFVGRQFLTIGGEEVIFVMWNVPLIVCGALCLVTLGLALLIPRTERAKHMNMFLLYHKESSEQPEEE